MNIDEIMRKQEESFQTYFSQFLPVKKIVESDSVILENISSVFDQLYLKSSGNSRTMCLGTGSRHKIYSFQEEPITIGDESLHLALKVSHIMPYILHPELDEIREFVYAELTQYHWAHQENKKPPKFVGLVKWKPPKKYEGSVYEEGIVGFLTEDITKRHSIEHTIKRIDGHEYIFLGTNYEKRLIDADLKGHIMSDVAEYENHIIEVN